MLTEHWFAWMSYVTLTCNEYISFEGEKLYERCNNKYILIQCIVL